MSIRKISKLLLALMLAALATQPAFADDDAALGLAAKANSALRTGADPIANTRNRWPLSRWGVKCNTEDASDQTAKVNDALSSGKPLLVECLVNIVGPIVLKNQTDIEGVGTLRSGFQALTSSVPSLVTLDTGRIGGLRLANFRVRGTTSLSSAGNVGQNGISLTCVKGTFGDGGIWYAQIDKLEIRQFDGVSFAMHGGADDTLCPHQYITVNMLDIERGSYASGEAVVLDGQVDKFTCVVCRWGGNSASAGASVFQGRNFYIGRKLVSGTAYSDVSPTNVILINFTSEYAASVGTVDRMATFSIDGGWFELNESGLTFQANAVAIISRALFNNSARTASTGTLITANSASAVTLRDTRCLGANSRYVATDGAGSVYVSGANPGCASAVSSNLIPQINLAGATSQIDAGNARIVFTFVTSGAPAIARITSSLAPGEEFVLQAGGSSDFTINTSTGTFPNNLCLGAGVTSRTISPGQFVKLLRVNNGGCGWIYVTTL